MEIGTGLLTGQRRPDDDRSMTAIYRELLEFARTAEDVGLDGVWVSEHHFSDDGYMPSVFPTLAAIAEATENVHLGTYIALAPLYDSIRLAEDTATVSLLAGDRLTAGLAIGYREVELEAFGVSTDERVDRTEDLIRVLRGAWSEGPLDYDPAFHDANSDIIVTPKPDNPPTILLGGSARSAVRRAALLGDGWGAPSSLSIEGVRKRHEHIRRIRGEEGLDDEFSFVVPQYGFVASSREKAWKQMKDGYLHLQRKYEAWFSDEQEVTLSAGRVQELKDQAIIGTPEDVIKGLERYRDALGDDIHFILRTYYPGIGTDEMLGCLELLGDEVAPQLR